ncbi:MAG: glycosyltransferase [Prevotella nanceiensis]|nr:glycosyltransferase [Hoylesella nanceiensis]
MIQVSIGIPFYNAQDFLEQAILSVLNQDFKSFELLLIDDGSTDRSLDIAYRFQDERIKVIHDGQNKGLSARLNELVALSKGEYFVRMDADDLMFPQRISRQLAYLQQHNEVDVVGSSAVTIDINNDITGIIRYPEHPNNISNVIQHQCFIHPSIMAKRSWFVQNPYDEGAIRIEDYNLWMRTFSKYRFYNIAEPLMFYRVSGLPYLDKYLLSMKGERKELKKHKEIIPNYHVVLLKNYLKCVLYYCFSHLHLIDVLLRLRSKSIPNSNDLESIKSALTTALQRNTKVKD